jgi:predicted O-methyltransferase YrrM
MSVTKRARCWMRRSTGRLGGTFDALATEHGFGAGFLFIDHDKKAYLPDLLSIIDRSWLHPGSIAVADNNIRIPGAPGYRDYMRQQQGKRWNTVSTRRTPNIKRWSPIWCWSPSTYADSSLATCSANRRDCLAT